ncbi:U-scoloptoxin(05)-Sm1a isoform X1 [Pieris brassicae]|uniref:U-scoloptoxin(05)-Sm1a isoform X1 n=1 Tax=Pieris brassicae TaxID=7116 RepID=UPI001E65FFB7|nr:U-scoloptoxin(05)-Sm1a isoform X1 [Pieris brassicae]
MSSQFLVYLFIIGTIKSVFSINCYQCSGTDSDNPFECNEYLDSETGLEPTDCSLIHDAQYCIKHIGRFEGGIGTKRYCSSLDLGNQCKYVQQPGDKLEYRTCIHTCTTDGCNSTGSLKISAMLLSISLVLFKIIS